MTDYYEKLFDATSFDKDECEAFCMNFNAACPKADMYMQFDGTYIHIYLNAISMKKYKSILGASSDDKAFVNALYECVRSIGNYGMRSGKRLYVNWRESRRVRNRQEKSEARGKYFYADQTAFSQENTTVPDEYRDRVVCGDSLSVLQVLPDNCVDIIFTSPPYNFGLDYATNDDTVDWQSYYDKLFAIFKECIRVLKYGGRFVVNVQPLYSDGIPAHHIISNFFMQQNMLWKGEILWEKNNYNCNVCAFGSWKSPSSPYLKYTWEFLEVFCKGSVKKPGARDCADISAEEFKSWVNAKWSITPELDMKKYGHPAMFPEALAERVLKLFSFKGDFVLDPFNGAGTTVVVAKRTGRSYLGIDICDAYCKTAEERLSETVCC